MVGRFIGCRPSQTCKMFLKLRTRGKIYGLLTRTGEVHQYDSTLKLIPYSADGGLGIDRIHTIFEAINGDLWFGHDNGVTVFNPRPAIQNHGTGISTAVRGKSRFAFWTDIVKIFEVDGYIWFVNKPIFNRNATRYTFFRYRNELFDQVSVFVKPKAGKHQEYGLIGIRIYLLPKKSTRGSLLVGISSK